MNTRTLLVLSIFYFQACYRSNSINTNIDTGEDPSDTNNEMDYVSEIDSNVDSYEVFDDDVIPDSDIHEPYCEYGKIGGDIQITFHSRPQHWAKRPMMAFTGSEFGIAWLDSRNLTPAHQVYFSRLLLDGEKVQEDMQISELDYVDSPSITFDGEYFNIIWKRQYGDPNVSSIVYSIVTMQGEKVGYDNIIFETDSEIVFPVMSSLGNNHGVLWIEIEPDTGNRSLMFANLGADGNILEGPLLVAQNIIDSVTPCISFSGSEFGVVWQNYYSLDAELFFHRVSIDGTLIDYFRQVTDTYPCEYPSMAFMGREYGIVCHGPRTLDFDINDISLIRLSASGEVISEEIQLSEGMADFREPSIVYSGSEYGISWADYIGGRIIMGRFQDNGTPIQGNIEIIANAIMSEGSIPLVSTGSEYSMAWHYGRDIYFTRIGCIR